VPEDRLSNNMVFMKLRIALKLNADQVLAPPQVDFVAMDVPSVPMPGKTKLARHWADA